MPRAGLNSSDVVAAGAELADETGIASVSLAALAERLGVKAPALYKHVESLGDLQHRIATLAMTEFGDALRDALQGKSGRDAIHAMFKAMQSYIAEHPGRYSAVNATPLHGSSDPLFTATSRVIDSIRAVLSGYGIAAADLDDAIRMLRCTLHGYSLLQASNAFHWSNDPGDTIDWMIRFVDTGLTAVGNTVPETAGR